MKKQIVFAFIAALLLAGVIGCENHIGNITSGSSGTGNIRLVIKSPARSIVPTATGHDRINLQFLRKGNNGEFVQVRSDSVNTNTNNEEDKLSYTMPPGDYKVKITAFNDLGEIAEGESTVFSISSTEETTTVPINLNFYSPSQSAAGDSGYFVSLIDSLDDSLFASASMELKSRADPNAPSISIPLTGQSEKQLPAGYYELTLNLEDKLSPPNKINLCEIVHIYKNMKTEYYFPHFIYVFVTVTVPGGTGPQDPGIHVRPTGPDNPNPGISIMCSITGNASASYGSTPITGSPLTINSTDILYITRSSIVSGTNVRITAAGGDGAAEWSFINHDNTTFHDAEQLMINPTTIGRFDNAADNYTYWIQLVWGDYSEHIRVQFI